MLNKNERGGAAILGGGSGGNDTGGGDVSDISATGVGARAGGTAAPVRVPMILL